MLLKCLAVIAIFFAFFIKTLDLLKIIAYTNNARRALALVSADERVNVSGP